MSMNDYYRPEALYLREDKSSKKEMSSSESHYPKFEVTYQVGDETKTVTITAKGVDFAKRLVYIKEGSLGNTGKVNIVRVVTL